MSENHHHFMRKADMTYIIVILTLCGAVWAALKEPMKWEKASNDIAELRPRVDKIEERVTELDARNTAQMTLIIRELDGIHKEVRSYGVKLRSARDAERD